MESAKLIAGLARIVHDVGLAEDLAQDALLAALERWPTTGVPDNPGAWLMATAKHRSIDQLRRRAMLERKHEQLGHELESLQESQVPDLDAALDDHVGDDLLRLMFTACHPVISTEARVALTLRLLGGLTTDEIARAFLVPEPTMAQRIVRAKRTLSDAKVPFEVPRGAEFHARLESVLQVIYLVFNEGYSATAGDELAAPRPVRGRAAPRPHPRRAGADGAGGARPRRADGDPGVALRGARQGRRASRFSCSSRIARDGISCSIRRGLAALARAESLARLARVVHAAGGDRGVSCARAHARRRRTGIASPSCIASSSELTRSPIVELNRAVAVSMAFGPALGLDLVDSLRDEPSLADYHLLPRGARGPADQAGSPERSARRSWSAPPRSRGTSASARCCSSAPSGLASLATS